MNVLEFIREKREDFQENTAQFKAMLEPTFQSWSNKLNDRITNTLNNPWIAGLNPFESSNLFITGQIFQNEAAAQTYENLKKQMNEATKKVHGSANPKGEKNFFCLRNLYSEVEKKSGKNRNFRVFRIFFENVVLIFNDNFLNF